MTRLRLAPAVAGALALVLAVPAAPAAAKAGPVHDEQIEFQRWSGYRDWRSGEARGALAVPGLPSTVTIGRPAGTVDVTDPHTGTTRGWEYATWTSPEHRIGFDATEIVASWNADTPAGTWIGVELLGTYTDGRQTPWYTLARWAAGDGDIKRSSADGQSDGVSSVWTDTVAVDDAAAGVLLRSYRLRLTLYRAVGQRRSPTVRQLGAMASHVPDRFTVPATPGGVARGVELRVPRYSQNVHEGHYPEYDNGGEAWCSPTSTTMVLEYWGRRPSERDLAWIDPAHPDRVVDHAARMTYDNEYQGAGNWPFNTAYAATYGLDAIVTRLHSVDELEHFIRAGIPVVTSQSFLASELDGAGYGTAGHLFVVVGFTAEGDVIVNDPASPSNDAVRRVYKRAQFEQVWLRTKRYRANGTIGSGSGGVAYLIKPQWKPWPRVAGSGNW